MLSNETLFFETNVVCPSCKHEFVVTKTKAKVKENMPIGYEIYLVPIYQYENANPLSYEINVCPKCFYAAFHSDYSTESANVTTQNMVKSFEKQLAELSKGVNFNIKYRTYEIARLSYIIAAFLYEKENKRDLIKIGKCFIRIAWFSKVLGENDFYRTALKRALDIYLEAYGEVDEVVTSATLLYLIGVIYIELGDFEAALPYVNKLNGDENARNLPQLKTKIEDASTLLREKLKSIDEENKGFNEDKKREAKRKRLEENRIKAYKIPFGVEVKKPDESKSEIREEIKKDELEESYGIKLTGKVKVLIVDDSKIVRASLKVMLEHACDIVGFATNGSEAIQMTAATKPDLITLDLEMPGLDGLETLIKIREFDQKVKILMLTSSGDTKMVYQTLKNGAYSYMLKPPNKEKLLEAIALIAKELK